MVPSPKVIVYGILLANSVFDGEVSGIKRDVG
jgi:hypothetical protein